MKISETDVDYVARLANLAIEPEERTALAGQLSRIVEYVEKLGTLDLEGVEPMSHVAAGAEPALREDRIAPRTGTSEAGKTTGLFKVPRVITER